MFSLYLVLSVVIIHLKIACTRKQERPTAVVLKQCVLIPIALILSVVLVIKAKGDLVQLPMVHCKSGAPVITSVTVIWEIFGIKIFHSHQRLQKLNTRNISTKNYQNTQCFWYYNTTILLQWLFPTRSYKHGSLECSKVSAAPPCPPFTHAINNSMRVKFSVYPGLPKI